MVLVSHFQQRVLQRRRKITTNQIARKTTNEIIRQFKADEPLDPWPLDDLVPLLLQRFLALAAIDIYRAYAETLVSQAKGWIAQNLARYQTRQRSTGQRSIILLRERMKSLGIAAPEPHLLETFVSTQQHALEQYKIWKENLGADIWGYRYKTQEDERVRLTHQPLNNTTLPKDDLFWLTYWPPNGWGCRCFIQVLDNPHKIRLPSEVVAPDVGFDNNIGILIGT